MPTVMYNGKCTGIKKFYAFDDKPRLPDERLYQKVEYNYMVAMKLKSLGFIVAQEFPLPEWGVIDIFAYKMVNSFGGKQYPEIIIAECKSEKDRNMMRALGQIITYRNQLVEYEYDINKAFIITRTEPCRQRIKKDLSRLSDEITEFKLVRFSNKTPDLIL